MATTFPKLPQELGSFTTSVSNGLPTLDTDGFATYGARYVNLWCQSSGGASAVWMLFPYLYRTGIGWVVYPDIPFSMTLYTVTNGSVFQIEVRGAERVYVRFANPANSPTGTILVEGFTYTS